MSKNGGYIKKLVCGNVHFRNKYNTHIYIEMMMMMDDVLKSDHHFLMFASLATVVILYLSEGVAKRI